MAEIVLDKGDQALPGRLRGRQRDGPRGQGRRVHDPRRPLGMRQVDGAADDRRAGGQVCELELGYVDVSTLATETVTIPINVNVVPGDEAAGRVPNPTVRSEVAFQSAQRAKREAAEAMRQGRPDQARGIWLQAAKTLDQHAPASAPEMRDEIQAEASMMRDLAQRAEYDDQAASRS